jgi:Flp pilus assembly protein TadG
MKLQQMWDDTRGNALVEFTVTASLFLLLMFGLLQAGLLLYTQAGLQHGVEAAARCASVNYSANQLGLNQSCFTGSGGIPTPSTVIADTTYSYITTYAAQNSWGINTSSASFNVTANSGKPAVNICGTTPGYQVTASYPYNIMNYLFHVTLAAQSCFPINIS